MRRHIFQAIADPTRRAIILLLTAGALTPNAIADNFDISRQAISKHLRVLNESEIIKPEQDGRSIKYHLNADKMMKLEQWLSEFKALMNSRFNQLDDVLEKLKNK